MNHDVPIESLIDHIKTSMDVDPWAKEMSEDFLKKFIPVKAIEKRAFISKLSGTQKSRIKGVIFNNELVQIGDSAFEGCTKIATIDFGGNNSHIVEIGNKAFYCGENKAYTGSLVMPSTLLFIGQYAFANFLQAKSLTLNNGLLLIGKAAFENLGKSVNDGAYLGKLDLILPNTLRDGFVYRLHPDGGDYTYCQSVGEAAFRNCKLIRTVTMQEYNGGVDGNSTSNNDNRMISFGHKVFADCTNLLRFTGSRRMMCLGTAMFMNCKYLKEVFLSTAFASKVGIDSFVWGCNDNQSIFFEGSDEDVEDFKDTIVYVEGAQAPSRKTRQQQYYVWNSDPKTYQNEYVTSANTDLYVPHTSGKVDDFTIDHIYGRLVVPTYFNVTYYNSGVMKYYDLSTNTLGDSPTDNYENCIALLNKSGNYIVTKCYASNNNGSIDLTSINLNITTIGSCAFSTLSSGNTASKVILPRTVTTIRDRAFYSIGEDGINTITYKDQNGVEAVDTAQSPTTNICILPPSMTRIEDFAFYNNDFEKVVLPEDLSMIGNTAFTCSNGANSSIRSFEGLGNSSAFTYVNDGVYDKDTKTLLYYAANGTGTLDLSSEDILAIGPRALAATKYSSFVMPDNSISKIFGGAFANNKNVTQISGLEDLEYIGYVPDTPEMWDTSIDPNTYDWDANFTVFNLPAKDFAENFTYSWYQVNKSRNAGGNLGVYKGNFALRQHFYRWLASFGAFAYCSNLETFDFTPFISSLKKIGYGAFEGCSKLKNTTNGGSYTYYKYYEGLTQANIGDKITNNDSVLANNTTKITNGTGVVDLSNAKQLQCIEREAFRDCSLLKYFHLPILTEFDNSKTDQADFYLGFNYWDKGSWYDLATDKNKTKCLKGRPFEGTGVANGAILIGETARYANVFGDKYFQPQVKINVDLSTVDLNHPNNGYPGQTDDKIYKVDNYDEIAYNLQRYTPDFYPSTSTYFYISQDVNDFDTYNFSADTISSHLDDIKHWIYYGDPANHQYILFDTASQVKTYLGIQ